MKNAQLAKLLVDQIEFCNIIVLNKTDLVTPDVVKQVKTIIQTLNPAAKIMESQFGKVHFSDICGTRLFALENAHLNKGWLKVLRGEEKSEADEFGISSFVWKRKECLNANSLVRLIESKSGLKNVIRSKGEREHY